MEDEQKIKDIHLLIPKLLMDEPPTFTEGLLPLEASQQTELFKILPLSYDVHKVLPCVVKCPFILYHIDSKVIYDKNTVNLLFKIPSGLDMFKEFAIETLPGDELICADLYLGKDRLHQRYSLTSIGNIDLRANIGSNTSLTKYRFFDKPLNNIASFHYGNFWIKITIKNMWEYSSDDTKIQQKEYKPYNRLLLYSYCGSGDYRKNVLGRDMTLLL